MYLVFASLFWFYDVLVLLCLSNLLFNNSNPSCGRPQTSSEAIWTPPSSRTTSSACCFSNASQMPLNRCRNRWFKAILIWVSLAQMPKDWHLMNMTDKQEGLHTHHINGVKHDNRYTNLKVLCALCHKGVDEHHGTMQVKKDIERYIQTHRP